METHSNLPRLRGSHGRGPLLTGFGSSQSPVWTNLSKGEVGETQLVLLLCKPQMTRTNQPGTCGSGDRWKVWQDGYLNLLSCDTLSFPVFGPLQKQEQEVSRPVGPGAGDSWGGILSARVTFPDCN